MHKTFNFTKGNVEVVRNGEDFPGHWIPSQITKSYEKSFLFVTRSESG